MVLSVRLGEQVDAYLDQLVKNGTYGSKAEAIRAALNSFAQIQTAKANGYRVVAVTDETLKRIGVAIEMNA